jgi:hypothetical protein
MLWKEEDGGYKWITRYSNNRLDLDHPPDIISKDSHIRFVDMVDKGEAELPDLWLYHVKEWRLGKATAVAYDDSGFAIAVGVIEKGLEPVAEFIAGLSPETVGVSHGMPQDSIKRDADDPKVIIEHVTKEITVLPMKYAANKLTGMYFIQKEDNQMGIPAEKKARLIQEWKMPEELLDKLTSSNAELAKLADEAGVAKKEAAEEETPVEKTPEVEKPAEEAPKEGETPQETTVDASEQSPSRKEVAEAIANVLTPLIDSVKELKDAVMGLETKLASVETGSEAKLKELLGQSTQASLYGMIRDSVIGSKATEVTKDDPLAKSKPKEAENKGDRPTTFAGGLVYDILNGK